MVVPRLGSLRLRSHFIFGSSQGYQRSSRRRSQLYLPCLPRSSETGCYGFTVERTVGRIKNRFDQSTTKFSSQVKWYHEGENIRYPQGREYYISNPGGMDDRNKTSVLTILKATDAMSGASDRVFKFRGLVMGHRYFPSFA